MKKSTITVVIVSVLTSIPLMANADQGKGVEPLATPPVIGNLDSAAGDEHYRGVKKEPSWKRFVTYPKTVFGEANDSSYYTLLPETSLD